VAKQTQPEVMNAAQAARYVGLSRPSFRKALRTIPHRRAGVRVLVRREALDRWLEGHEGKGAE
jgi:excisionase family DNA binding protein